MWCCENHRRPVSRRSGLPVPTCVPVEVMSHRRQILELLEKPFPSGAQYSFAIPTPEFFTWFNNSVWHP